MNERIADAVEKAKFEIAKLVIEEIMQMLLGSGIEADHRLKRALERIINVRIRVER